MVCGGATRAAVIEPELGFVCQQSENRGVAHLWANTLVDARGAATGSSIHFRAQAPDGGTTELIWRGPKPERWFAAPVDLSIQFVTPGRPTIGTTASLFARATLIATQVLPGARARRAPQTTQRWGASLFVQGYAGGGLHGAGALTVVAVDGTGAENVRQHVATPDWRWLGEAAPRLLRASIDAARDYRTLCTAETGPEI